MNGSISGQIIDVSHTIEHGMVTYAGLPAPIICDYWTRESSSNHYAPGVSFQIGKIEMVANTGTYVDSPFHRFERGRDLSELPLMKLVNLPSVTIRAIDSQSRAIDVDQLRGYKIMNKAVLIHTNWAKNWNSDKYFTGHPFLTEAGALYLRDSGAILVGIDSLNIDDTNDGRRPVHSILLRAEIPIVEHLTRLDKLPQHGYRFFAPPVKVKAFGSFPVRAFAILD